MQPTLVDLLLALIVEGPIGVAVSCRLAATLTKDLSAQFAHSCGHLSSAMLTGTLLAAPGTLWTRSWAASVRSPRLR